MKLVLHLNEENPYKGQPWKSQYNHRNIVIPEEYGEELSSESVDVLVSALQSLLADTTLLSYNIPKVLGMWRSYCSVIPSINENAEYVFEVKENNGVTGAPGLKSFIILES